MNGLTINDFQSPEAYGVHLIERAKAFWSEYHWKDRTEPVVDALDTALEIAADLLPEDAE